MESQGAASPGLLVLTTGLSKPFRRLEKYAGMLQELERHVEENHPDRGDTQRSVSVYKDIAVSIHFWIQTAHSIFPKQAFPGTVCLATLFLYPFEPEYMELLLCDYSCFIY
jgi:hypothetical protein